MSTTYPSQIDTNQSLPTVIDGQTPVQAVIFNRLRNAVVAIEAALGAQPNGIYATVASRLNILETTLGNLSVISLSQDIGGTLNNPIVVGLQGRPISSAVPTAGNILAWNGIAWAPASGEPPSGPASGDLTGNFPNPTVSGILNEPLPSLSAGFLNWNGSAWVFINNSSVFTPGGDLSGTSTEQTVIGIQHNPVSNVVPSTGQTFVWSGTQWTPGTNFGNQTLQTTGQIISGPLLATSVTTGLETLTGKFIVNAVSAPTVSDARQGIIYFDSTQDKFLVSENGNSYVPLLIDDTTAGGDLTGTLPNPTIAKIQGVIVSSPSSLNDGYALVTNGSGIYVPTGVVPVFNVKNFGAVGNGIIDDTVAIQNTINAAAPIGGTVYFPHNNPNSIPVLVSAASNASPIEITTSSPHGLSTGQLVWVTGVLGNLAANGYFICTVVDGSHVTLNGSTGSGTYTSGGTIQLVQGYRVTSPLTVSPNLRLVGDGSTFISGYALSPTTIYDARIGASTPLIDFTTDSGMPVLPTSRGCYFRGISFVCPDPSKTAYSFLVTSTGLTCEDCHFQGAEIPGGSDPGMWYLGAFEGVSFLRCTFQWGTTQFTFLGSGAGGPMKWERCWFYDCFGSWIMSESNGDHDYTIDGCAFDPLYRTTVPAVGISLAVNGFTIRNTSFFGNPGVQPTGPYIELQGTGSVTGCAIHSLNSTGIKLNSGQVDISSNAFFCYCAVSVGGGDCTLTGSNNVYTPSLVADQSGDLYPFNAKRAVIINEPYSGSCMFNVGPDQFISSDGYSWLESYHIGGQPAVGIVVGTSSGTSGAVVLIMQQAHGLSAGDVVDVEGVTGTTEANGLNQTVTVVSATQLLLQGTTYVHTWTGGGRTQYHAAASYQQYTNGRITYSKTFDASTNGPIVGGITTLTEVGPQMLIESTGTVLTQNQQYPNFITNENYDGYTINYTLPPIVPGMVYEFQKRPVNNSQSVAPTMQINADSTDIALDFGQIMLPGSGAGLSSIYDADINDFNSSIRLRAIYWFDAAAGSDIKRWIIEDMDGNWQSTAATPISRRANTTNITANYDILVTDQIIMVGVLTGTITVTLPSNHSSGDTYIIKDAQGYAGTYAVSVNTADSIDIDGAAILLLNSSYQAITVVYNSNTNIWNII
jgi:Pectate lyase superfamily protein